ncbi:MAG: glycoside hydrolase family 5 protein [Phycisphaerae bacterium]
MSFDIHRGTNISHFLSQSPRRGTEREQQFTRADFDRLVELGVDHLRLPIDEEQMWDHQGNRQPAAWDLMNRTLDWCDQADIRCVVDLHILRSHYFNDPSDKKTLFLDEAEAEKFARFWVDLSNEMKHRPVEKVAYELMNEPVADDPADWNRVYRYPYHAVREREPERTILIGSNSWNQAATFPELDIPQGDRNIILVFHYYNSMIITHYEQKYVPEVKDYHGPIQYPGRPIPTEVFEKLPEQQQRMLEKWNRPFGPDAMEQDIAPALQVAGKHGLKLYCNEFGVNRSVPEDIRERWCRDFRAVLEGHDIAWANWDYRGGFGLYDRENDEPTGILRGLFG